MFDDFIFQQYGIINLSMLSQKHSTQRKQRFKIEVIKKKVKRIQSTPHKLQPQYPTLRGNITENNQQVRPKKQQYQIYERNPQSQQRTEEIQSTYRVKSHIKSKSQLWNDGFNFQISGAEQLGLDSIVINSIMQQNIYKGYSTLEDPILSDYRVSEVIDKKFSEQKMMKKPVKSSNNHMFQDLNIVKCQSITLLQASRKNRQLLRPSKYLNSSKKQSSISRRKIKITNTNTNKMIFNLNSDPDAMYTRKLKIHLDFLFKVNFSNRIFINFDLRESQIIKKYKVYVGWGNNNQVIKNCLRNRFWFEFADNIDESDIRFFWTPWPIRSIFNREKDRTMIQTKQMPIVLNKKMIKKQVEYTDINEKLFMQNQHIVQNFIVEDGYIIPFPQQKSPHIISNHLSNSAAITQKKKLFHSLFHYYRNVLKSNPFDVIPLTYNVTGVNDPEFKRFVRDNQGKEHKIWIIKPGENTNRGEGICLAKMEDVSKYLTQGVRQTFVIQSYIDKPLLYNGRKFDVRHFLLLTCVNGLLKAYWFKQGYVRTSSETFDLQNLDNKYIHLTNDAIQQHSENYGFFQAGNKISYSQLQRYLEIIYPKRGINFETDILDKMKQIICNVIKANYKILDCRRKEANFQLLGIDFMIDRDLRPWLIQINENPCLQTSCQLLSRLIPSVVENTMRLCIDPLLAPSNHYPPRLRSSLNDHYLKSLKYRIIFDECEYERCNGQH